MNRIHYFIKNILQNSKLNKEKFVNNKKKYNMIKAKNINYLNVSKIIYFWTIVRSFSSIGWNYSVQKIQPNGPNVIFVLLLECCYYGSAKSFDYINQKK